MRLCVIVCIFVWPVSIRFFFLYYSWPYKTSVFACLMAVFDLERRPTDAIRQRGSMIAVGLWFEPIGVIYIYIFCRSSFVWGSRLALLFPPIMLVQLRILRFVLYAQDLIGVEKRQFDEGTGMVVANM